MLFHISGLVTAALCLASALASPLLPSQDPFYKQPSNVGTYKPGQIIRKREIPPHLSGFIVPNATESVKAAYQYLYRTTDSIGDPVAAVTTLLVPYNADPSKLLAYQTAYDSANNDCSPSYALQSGANTTAIADIVFITAALDKGWFVVSPDFEGLQAQFVAGVQAGYATLDSVRAAFNEAQYTGLSPKAKYAMWGYSGGSLASEWAAELQSKYAPELHFEGTALGGLTPNVTNVLLTINNGSFAGLAFSGISGIGRAYPNLTQYLNQHLIPSKRAEFDSIAAGCLEQAASSGSGKDLYTFFDNSQRALYDPIPQSVIAAGGQMGTHGVPTMPLFVYKANGDEISPASDTDALVKKLCSKGAVIEYHKDIFGEHVSEAITGSASAFTWIEDRLNGKLISNPGQCVTQNVALSSTDLPTLLHIPEELIALLQDTLLGGNLGPLISG